jgi:hypothetical protein
MCRQGVQQAPRSGSLHSFENVKSQEQFALGTIAVLKDVALRVPLPPVPLPLAVTVSVVEIPASPSHVCVKAQPLCATSQPGALVTGGPPDICVYQAPVPDEKPSTEAIAAHALESPAYLSVYVRL